MLCSPRADTQTDTQTDRQTDTKVNTEDTLSGIFPSTYHQGSVQNTQIKFPSCLPIIGNEAVLLFQVKQSNNLVSGSTG